MRVNRQTALLSSFKDVINHDDRLMDVLLDSAFDMSDLTWPETASGKRILESILRNREDWEAAVRLFGRPYFRRSSSG